MLRTEKLHIGAVYPFALVISRVRACDVETSILHEIEIGISTTALSTASEAFAAVSSEPGILSSGSGFGLSLFRAILIVCGNVRCRAANPGRGASEQCEARHPERRPSSTFAQPIHLTDSPHRVAIAKNKCGLFRADQCCVPNW